MQTLSEGLKQKISNSWGTKNIINPNLKYINSHQSATYDNFQN